MKNKVPVIVACSILIVLVYFPIFGHLDTLPIRLWDESRLAINAYEMNKYGDWIVTHYDGKPDMWNTKPPLMIWLQVICMKCLGVNELSVRLPSAMAAFLLCGLLLFIAIRYLKDFWFGFIAIIVLITFQGFISEHGSRTGDYDVMATFFMTASCLFFFLYTETQKTKFLYLVFAGTILAALTKGITSMLFMPGLFIYLLFSKQLWNILRNKHFYIGLAVFFFFVIGYYALREHLNPGFFEAVINNELGGRYFNVIEGNTGDFWYYYNNITNDRFAEWALLVPCGLLIGLVYKDRKLYKLTLFSIILLITYFLIISISKTKLQWYDIPMFPYLVILVSIFIYFIFKFLKNNEALHRDLKLKIAPYIFLFLVCIIPYKKIIDKTFIPKENEASWQLSEVEYFLKNAIKGNVNIENHYFLIEGYNAQNWFYIRILQDKGVRIGYKNWTNLQINDTVIACQNNIKDYINHNYVAEVLRNDGNISIYKIIEKKIDEKKTN